jgi:hypothetical protein
MNFGLQEMVPVLGYIPSAIILTVTFALLTYWVLVYSPLASWFSTEEVVPPFFSYAAIIFALFAAMIASDIWGRYKDASMAVVSEASAVRSLLITAAYVDPVDADAIRNSVARYVTLVVDQEWPAMKVMDNEQKEAGSSALIQLSSVVLGSMVNKPQARPFEARLQQAIDTLRTARLTRLSYAFDPVQYGKWRGLMLFGFLTLFSVGLCHVRRPRAMKIALAVTAVGIVITATVLANHRSPYVGTDPVKPQLLKESLELLELKNYQPLKGLQ